MIFTDIEIPKYLYLTESIDEKLLMNNNFTDLKGPFNLTSLEYIYHIASGFRPFNDLFMGDIWFFFDPSDLEKMCITPYVKFRFAYAGEAREQLNHYCRYNPALKKLLQLKPAYNLKATIKIFKDRMVTDTVINYVGKNKEEFLMEKQKWEMFLEERYK